MLYRVPSYTHNGVHKYWEISWSTFFLEPTNLSYSASYYSDFVFKSVDIDLIGRADQSLCRSGGMDYKFSKAK